MLPLPHTAKADLARFSLGPFPLSAVEKRVLAPEKRPLNTAIDMYINRLDKIWPHLRAAEFQCRKTLSVADWQGNLAASLLIVYFA